MPKVFLDFVGQRLGLSLGLKALKLRKNNTEKYLFFVSTVVAPRFASQVPQKLSRHSAGVCGVAPGGAERFSASRHSCSDKGLVTNTFYIPQDGFFSPHTEGVLASLYVVLEKAARTVCHNSQKLCQLFALPMCLSRRSKRYPTTNM